MALGFKAWVNEIGAVEVDLTDFRASTAESIDDIFGEILRLARPLGQKPWVMVCAKNTVMEGAAAERYQRRIPEIYAASRGVIRYQVTNFVVRVNVQMDAAAHAASSQSHLFPTREEAVRAVTSGSLDRPAPRRGRG